MDIFRIIGFIAFSTALSFYFIMFIFAFNLKIGSKKSKPLIINASEMKEKMLKHTNKVKSKKGKIIKKVLKFIQYLIEESLQKGKEEMYVSRYFNFEYSSLRTLQLVKFHRLDIFAEIIKAGYDIDEVKDGDYISYKIDLREFYQE